MVFQTKKKRGGREKEKRPETESSPKRGTRGGLERVKGTVKWWQRQNRTLPWTIGAEAETKRKGRGINEKKKSSEGGGKRSYQNLTKGEVSNSGTRGSFPGHYSQPGV